MNTETLTETLWRGTEMGDYVTDTMLDLITGGDEKPTEKKVLLSLLFKRMAYRIDQLEAENEGGDSS